MSSYLNIYGRVRDDLYKMERLKDKEIQKEDYVVLIDSFSRNSAIYNAFKETMNPAYAGDKEIYSPITLDSLNDCVEYCKDQIKIYEDMLVRDKESQELYMEYLQNRPETVNYSDFINLMPEDSSEEVKEEIDSYNDCIGILETLRMIVHSIDYKYCGFSELLCNID